MKLKNLFIVFLIAVLSGCETNEVIIEADNLLLGNWIYPTYASDTTTFTRSTSLPDEGSGIAFNQNGTFIERTSGWCGTPPLTYYNVEGSFTIDNNLISINSSQSYPSFYGWKIIELTNTKLVVKRELSEQEKDHIALMDLFSEISNLAYSETCSAANDWSFVAYGAKACGGSQGYIPYHKNIDVSSFLEKVENYTKAEKDFNIKWSVISDCAVVNTPKSVDCQYNYPVLIY